MECTVAECVKPVKFKSHGLCNAHYQKFMKYGDATVVRQKQRHGLSLQERFDGYVDKSGDCWLWTNYRDKNGYGRLNINNRPILAHRISWELHCGEITPEEHVLHRCDNPPCVNPAHLFLGDQVANNADMMAKGRFNPGVSKGSAHGCAKLNEEQVLKIRASSTHSQELADHYGVSRTTINDIRARRIWRHI